MIALATLNLLADEAATAAAAAGGRRRAVARPAQPRRAHVPGPPAGQRPDRAHRRRVRTGHDRCPSLPPGCPSLDLPRTRRRARPGRVLAEHGTGLSYADGERILREAAGNPLALVELPVAVRAAAEAGLAAAPEPLPLTARLERAFSARLGGLPPQARGRRSWWRRWTIPTTCRRYSRARPRWRAASLGVAALEGAVAVGLDPCSTGCTSGSGIRSSARPCCSRRRSVRTQAANAALAGILTEEPYRRTWHRAQSSQRARTTTMADELEEDCTRSRCGAARRPARSGRLNAPRS